jgi:ABC-type multidrug transport system fused ATPase/permease subunit
MQEVVADPYREDLESAEAREKSEKGDRRRLAILWRLTPLLRPHKARFALALATLFAASGIALVYPWAAKQAVDIGMSQATTDKLDDIVLFLVAVFAVNAVLVWFRHYSMS